jgi:hypothetical protein
VCSIVIGAALNGEVTLVPLCSAGLKLDARIEPHRAL